MHAGSLLKPARLWTRSELLSRPCPVPKTPGIYAWYFRHLLPPDAISSCHRSGEFSLLYVGIAPTAPRATGKSLNPQRSTINFRKSTQTLRRRIQYHVRGNAEGSSLRLSLGCLLAEQLGLELRRVGSGTRMTFDPKEQLLSNWLETNARVTWLEHPEPWFLETELIQSVSLPLNLDQNSTHPFFSTLSALRAQARARARDLPILLPGDMNPLHA